MEVIEKNGKTADKARQEIKARLTEIVHPATLAQVSYFHRLGLRARLLTLPVMVPAAQASNLALA